MAVADNQTYDDRLLTRYLLGSLGDEETERLDELSIADDEFASRLQAVEDDLVDAYVRGELSGEILEQFRSFYLSSGRRRAKVQFAEALFRATDLRQAATRRERSRTWLSEWALAAACLLLAAGGLLLYQNLRLRDEVKQAQAAIAALRQHVQTAVPPPPLEKSPPQPPRVQTVAMFLAPQPRAASPLPTLKLPPETDQALLHLGLESDEFAGYRAGLRNPATNQIVWRSDLLHSSTRQNRRVVSVSIPGAVFEPGNYTLELSGIIGGHRNEFVSSYTFRIER
jgi:hypothetical protein